MKIWVIGRSYPNKKNQMAGSFELEQAKMLAKNGHEVVYIACVFHPYKKVNKWGFCKWTEDNVDVYTYSQLYFPGRLHIYLNSFQNKRWKQLFDKVENDKGFPDIIHVHYPTLVSQPQTILNYKNRGVKIFATEHWTAVQTGQINKHELNQLKFYVNEANRFICVGKPLKDKILQLTNSTNQLDIIPYVVPDYFDCKPKTWKDFRFVAVGRLVPVKQFDQVINAFYKAFHNQNDVTLSIIGGGEEYNNLRKLIDSLGAADQIKLLGTLPRNKTAEMVSESDVLVCFSRLETFGVPVIEAWYCGIPVISSDAIGFAEYFNDDMGILISYKDEEKLVESMKEIYEQYSKYSKDNISNYSKSLFSEAAVCEKLIKLYKEA